MENRLNEEGFIMQYLISGLREEPFIDHTADENQLRYEKYLRSILTRPQTKEPQDRVKLNETGSLGLPWRYYYNYGNWFVDLSTFYSVLTRVEMDACTQLEAEEDMQVRAVVWSYASVDLWCNGEHVCAMAPPVYKPIQKQNVMFNLKKGINRLYIRLQTLGVRDTRTLFGIQVIDHKDEIRVVLPDEEHTNCVLNCAKWLDQLIIQDGKLFCHTPAPKGTTLGYDSMSPDFAKAETKVERHDIGGATEAVLEAGRPYIVVECTAEGQKLARRMEDTAMIVPSFLKVMDYEKNKEAIYHRISDVESLSRGGKFGFYPCAHDRPSAVGSRKKESRTMAR